MAVWLPALDDCLARMTAGERRLAQRLDQRLDHQYRVWYGVSAGPRPAHPNFLLLHPRHGLLVLEVRDWRLDAVRHTTPQYWSLEADGQPRTVMHPLAQARHCALQLAQALEQDAQLLQTAHPERARLAVPWAYGMVLSRITRRQFDSAGLAHATAPHRVLCADELQESIPADAFLARLARLREHAADATLTPAQLDRIRWILFPDVRIAPHAALLEQNSTLLGLPDAMPVMDLQQEQLARSLGQGTQVIRGAPGTGKTTVLCHQAEGLARALAPTAKPVLVLCYNEPLAVRLEALFASKGLADLVHARHFHHWCYHQLQAYGQPLPPQGPQFSAQLVQALVRAVDQHHIPTAQYHAVLIDECQEFEPAWLALLARMADPATNHLLLLYDDARPDAAPAPAGPPGGQGFGPPTPQRSAVLRVNYRSTRQILETAQELATGLLPTPQGKAALALPPGTAADAREGPAVTLVRLPTLYAEAARIAEMLSELHHGSGQPWSGMAVLCRNHEVLQACADALERRQVPHRVRRKAGDYRPLEDAVAVMTMKASKGLEFAVVAIPGVGHLPAPGENPAEEARLLYGATMRATDVLILGTGGHGTLAAHLHAVPGAVNTARAKPGAALRR